MRKLHSFLINGALVAASIGVSVLLLEIGLRVGGYKMREARLLCLDGVIGNVFCPGVKAAISNQNGGTITVAINSEGMADHEYTRTKPPGTTRVALLGDSVAASIYTPAEEKFKTLWEVGLSTSLKHAVQVMNFAVDGQGTWDELQLFHLRARHFKPDFVVLAFYWGNDTWNNTTLRDKGRPNPLKDEYPEPTGLRKLQVQHRFAIRWLWNHSAAYQFLDDLKETIEQTRSYQAGMKVVPSEDKDGSPPLIYDGAFDWDSDAWQLSRELILKLQKESEQARAKLIVFHLPTLDQITKPQPLPYRKFRQFLDRNNIANVDAFDSLEKLPDAEKRDLYVADHWHLSTRGHRFVAEATLPKLRAIIGGPSSPSSAKD